MHRLVALALVLVLTSYALSGLLSAPAYAQEPPLGTAKRKVGIQQVEPSTLEFFKEHFSGGWDIVIYDGNNQLQWVTLTTSLSWTTPFGAAEIARTTYVVADGQSFSEDQDLALFKGSPVVPSDAFPGADPRLGTSSGGGLWDTLTVPVTSLMLLGDTSATAAVQSTAAGDFADCLVWVAQIFAHGPSSVAAGYAAQGTSLRNQPYGIVSIADIPDGALVTGAFLYFTVLADTMPVPSMSLNGVDVGGRAILVGSDVSPCWEPLDSFSFRYDVTDLVARNGVYTVSGYPTDDTSFDDPFLVGCTDGGPCADGASLIVLYDPTPVGGVVIDANPTSGLLLMLPWIFVAVMAVGVVSYAMRKRYA